jgi:hypothetical protein
MADTPAPEPAPEPATEPESSKPVKKKREGTKLTDKQKSALAKHREKMKKEGMEGKELKSHSMKMMTRVRKGMSVSAAHKDIMKGQ